MKQRDIKELHVKTIDELRSSIKELKESVVVARLDLSQQKLTNTSSLTTMRTDIARMMTVLQGKVLAQEANPTEGGKA